MSEEQGTGGGPVGRPPDYLSPLHYRPRGAQWQPMRLGDIPLAGFEWWPLHGDEEGAWQAYWMRVAPGATSPRHVHPSTELLFIHEGYLVDEDGRRFEAGDSAVFLAGSSHFTHSPTGCSALVVARSNPEVLHQIESMDPARTRTWLTTG